MFIRTTFLLLSLLVSSSLFAQKIQYKIPEGYEDAISSEDYKELVDLSVKKISEKFTVISVKDGFVALEDGSGYRGFNLHNVILKSVDIDRKDWPLLIQDHFNSLFSVEEEKGLVNMDDFESIQKYLSIRIYLKELVAENGGPEKFIIREDLDGTYTVLMLDLPSTFSPISADISQTWGKTKDELFRMAQDNVNKQALEKMSKTFKNDSVEVEIHFLSNDDYAASCALDLEKNAPEMLGEWGAVLAIPNKGIVNLCTVSPEKPLDFVLFIQLTHNVVKDFYMKHPQPVSTDFFWYYKGEFTKILVVEEAGNISVINPMGLTELMTK